MAKKKPKKKTKPTWKTWEKKETRVRQRSFLRAFSKCGAIGKACVAAKVGRTTVFYWDKGDPVFARRYAVARERWIEKLEIEADRRATKGVKSDVFYQGVKCGEKTEYSDKLLMFRLAALRPEVYRTRSLEVMTPGEVKASMERFMQKLREKLPSSSHEAVDATIKELMEGQ